MQPALSDSAKANHMSTSQLPSHVAPIRKRDYIAVRDPVSDQLDKDRVLALRVTHVTDESVRGIEVKYAHYEELSVEVPLSCVYANFGRNPPTMMVGGTNIGEVFDKFTHPHEFWGDIHFSYKPEEDELTRIMKGYDRVHSWLSKNGLERLGELPVIHEITHVAKKYAGMVTAPGNLSKSPIRMRFTPSHTEAGEGPLTYVVAHEVGHIIDLGLLRSTSPKLRGKWVSAYSETMQPVSLDKDACNTWLDEFLSFEDVRDFRAKVNADEDAAAALKVILDHLRRTRHLGLPDLLLLRESDQGADRIREIWPIAKTCVAGEKKPAVSDYATTNPRELFAESFAFFVTKKELPPQVHELMEQSIGRAQKVLPLLLKELSNPLTKD